MGGEGSKCGHRHQPARTFAPHSTNHSRGDRRAHLTRLRRELHTGKQQSSRSPPASCWERYFRFANTAMQCVCCVCDYSTGLHSSGQQALHSDKKSPDTSNGPSQQPAQPSPARRFCRRTKHKIERHSIRTWCHPIPFKSSWSSLLPTGACALKGNTAEPGASK